MTSSVRLPLATTVCGGSTYTLYSATGCRVLSALASIGGNPPRGRATNRSSGLCGLYGFSRRAISSGRTQHTGPEDSPQRLPERRILHDRNRLDHVFEDRHHPTPPLARTPSTIFPHPSNSPPRPASRQFARRTRPDKWLPLSQNSFAVYV